MLQQFTKPARKYMFLMMLVAWLALLLQLYLTVSNSHNNGITPLMATWNFFSYFTVLTNLMIAVCLSCLLFNPASSAGRFFSNPVTLSAICLYIFMVGLAYNLLLRSVWSPTGLQKWVDEALHVVVPLLYIIFWVLFVPKGFLKWIHPLRWLVYPGLYLIYALLRGEFTGFHAYPFINTANMGYSRVLLNAGGLMLVFIIAGFILVAIDQSMSRAKKTALT